MLLFDFVKRLFGLEKVNKIKFVFFFEILDF